MWAKTVERSKDTLLVLVIYPLLLLVVALFTSIYGQTVTDKADQLYELEVARCKESAELTQRWRVMNRHLQHRIAFLNADNENLRDRTVPPLLPGVNR